MYDVYQNTGPSSCLQGLEGKCGGQGWEGAAAAGRALEIGLEESPGDPEGGSRDWLDALPQQGLVWSSTTLSFPPGEPSQLA